MFIWIVDRLGVGCIRMLACVFWDWHCCVMRAESYMLCSLIRVLGILPHGRGSTSCSAQVFVSRIAENLVACRGTGGHFTPPSRRSMEALQPQIGWHSMLSMS